MGDAHVVGRRTLPNAFELMPKLRSATCNDRFQLTTDGLKAYEGAVDGMISDRMDFAQLIKIYASPREGEQRYSRLTLWRRSQLSSAEIPIRSASTLRLWNGRTLVRGLRYGE